MFGDRTEEDAAVEVLAVADAFELQDESRQIPLGLQVAGPVLDVEPALLVDRELRFELGLLHLRVGGLGLGEIVELPAGEVFGVEEGVFDTG